MLSLVRFCAITLWLAAFVPLTATEVAQTPVPSAVKAWEDTISLPTYDEGLPPEDPPFTMFRSENWLYPYTMRTQLGTTPRPETWRVIHLENEFLACSVLPDLGGHLYRCIDKANGHDVFHPALSIKKAAVAPRGSWISTGIEFNFPVGHSWDTVSPVDFHSRQNDDGSASVFVGDTDRISRLQWLVELILRPGSSVLEQRVTLYNPGEFKQRYYWWANAAVTVESPDTTFVYPTYLMYLDGHPDTIIPWPKNREGVDMSRQGNSKDMVGLFAVRSKEPFMAVYNPASKTGVAHYADPVAVPGKKVWSWGKDMDGWVRKNLTDNDTTYVELQAGVLDTNSDYEFLEPQQIRRFTEYWMPVHNMDGITRATLDAVLNLQRHDENVLVQIEANHDIGHAQVRLTAGATKLLDETVDLTTREVYSKSIPVTSKEPLSFELLDSQGKPLSQHTEGVYDAMTAEQAAAQKPPPPVALGCNSQQSCFEEGIRSERIGALSFAYNSYSVGLDRFGYSPVGVKALARLDVQQAHFNEAIKRYQRISFGGAPLDPESEYYWGIALYYTGDVVTASHHWENALKGPIFGIPAQLELAYNSASQGHWNEALAGLARLDALSKRLTRAGELEVIALRRSGDKGKADQRLQAWLAIDPTNCVLRTEATLLGNDDPSLWLHLAAEPERVLNAVDTYLRAADYGAALSLLERTYPQVPANQMEPGAVLPQQHPLIAYYRGYCKQMLGKPAAEDYAAASRLPVKYVFPSRFSSLAVLRAAIRSNKADGTAHYLLGSLELHFAVRYLALEDLRAAVRLNFKEPVVYWDLARLLDQLGDTPDALAALRDARALGPLPENVEQFSAKLAAKPAPAVSNAKRSFVPAAVAPAPPSPVYKPPADTSALSPDELARFVFNELTGNEVDAAEEALKQDRLKQVPSNDLLRQAYYETKLQNALFMARKRQCDGMASIVLAATEADAERPFTKPGGKPVLESPRFLFYLGRSFGLCGDAKKAEALWKQAAGKQRDITSPEYAFPVLARVQLSALHRKPVRPELEKALEEIDEKLKSASKEQSTALNYSAGLLLQALGRLDDAESRFRAAMKGDPTVEYTARIGLRDSDLARHGVK
jgi:tetratricopeptide (TPR) repeat protein